MTARLEVDTRGVATLTIDRPERKNALDGELRRAIVARIGEIPRDARCVVLRGAGDTFCAGADIGAMREAVDYTKEQNLRDAEDLGAVFARLDDLPMPLLARVQGAAIGGGAGLVAVADIAVATATATFAFSEVRLGILPAVIAPYVVRKCGPAYATVAFTTGLRFDGREAQRMGLVHEVTDDETALDARLAAYVDAILSGGPAAVARAKQMVREVAGRSPREVEALMASLIAAVRIGDEGQEGLRAFLERRPPRWTP